MVTNITVTEPTVVKPSESTPTTTLWISNIDSIFPTTMYARYLFFYRYSGNHGADFFDSAMLKSALGRTLVYFYSFAGRLTMNGNDRIEINCSGEGALFVVAKSDGALDDLGDFSLRSDVSLIPPVDYSQGISGNPLLMVQVTRFRCGGVCVGIAADHHLADGTAFSHFFNTWANISRGEGTVFPPFIDRRLALSARSPPRPEFIHVEYQPPPAMSNTAENYRQPISRMFKLTKDQIAALKAKCQEVDQNGAVYTTFEALSGHAWRCLTLARQLPYDQQTKLRIAVDGRSRIQPALPQGYFGNVLFHATPVAQTGDLVAKPVGFSARKIRQALSEMQSERLRSALDYLEMESDHGAIAHNLYDYDTPNVSIVSWVWLPLYDVDFGWGKPWFVSPGYGRGIDIPSGTSVVVRAPGDDGGLVFLTAAAEEELERFGKSFLDI